MLFSLATSLVSLPVRARAQEPQEELEEEIVGNLAAGRVLVVVAKDGIAIATLESRVEPNTRPPLIVPLGTRRAGILLGAVDWVDLDSDTHFARLDKDLPKLHSTATPAGPRLQHEVTGGIATDIEDVGLGLFERLRNIVKKIHAKLDLAPEEAFVELVLADYVEGYGPEVWVLSYPLEQLPLRGDYWETRALRPRYTQLWPPEKGQPRNLLEVRYPQENVLPPLLDLLRQNDQRLQRLHTAGSSNAALAELLEAGDTSKAQVADTLPFLRATLGAIAALGTAEVVAVISEKTGFDWILAPVEEANKPGKETARPPDAPTLLKQPP